LLKAMKEHEATYCKRTAHFRSKYTLI